MILTGKITFNFSENRIKVWKPDASAHIRLIPTEGLHPLNRTYYVRNRVMDIPIVDHTNYIITHGKGYGKTAGMFEMWKKYAAEHNVIVVIGEQNKPLFGTDLNVMT